MVQKSIRTDMTSLIASSAIFSEFALHKISLYTEYMEALKAVNQVFPKLICINGSVLIVTASHQQLDKVYFVVINRSQTITVLVNKLSHFPLLLYIKQRHFPRQ